MKLSALASLFMMAIVLSLLPFAQSHDENQEESYWGMWESWTCSKPCGMGKVVRSRPCIGVQVLPCLPVNASNQYSPDDCRLAVCPKDCGEKKWGLDCYNECPNCLEDCDKSTGYCTSCVPGFYNPPDGPLNCSTECPENTYGFECRGSCLTKCNRDCLDRRVGTCGAIAVGALYLYHKYFLILLIIPALTILSELIRKTQWRRGQGEEQFKPRWRHIPTLSMYKNRNDYTQQTDFEPPEFDDDDDFMSVDLPEDAPNDDGTPNDQNNEDVDEAMSSWGDLLVSLKSKNIRPRDPDF